MIEKLATICHTSWSEFLDLNHTSNTGMLVPHLIPMFAPEASREIPRASESARS